MGPAHLENLENLENLETAMKRDNGFKTWV
jgi:hypothetical protein